MRDAADNDGVNVTFLVVAVLVAAVAITYITRNQPRIFGGGYHYGRPNFF